MTPKKLFVFAALCLIHPLTGVAENTHTLRRVEFREPCQTHYFLVEAANAESRDRLGSTPLARPEWTQARLGDWTYWSTQHFYESSAGEWRLEVSDERNTILGNAPSGSTPAKGSVTYAELIIRGVPVADADRDGLHDGWEFRHFGRLDYGPKDDPDEDGLINAREQIMGTNPTAPNAAFRLDLTELTPGYLRLSWPSQENVSYTVLSGGDLSQPLVPVNNVAGSMPVAEFVVKSRSGDQFYRVFRAARQHDATIQLPE